jgi:hypothetical protein
MSLLSAPDVTIDAVMGIGRARAEGIAPHFIEATTSVINSWLRVGREVPQEVYDDLLGITWDHILTFEGELREIGADDVDVLFYRVGALDVLTTRINAAKALAVADCGPAQ